MLAMLGLLVVGILVGIVTGMVPGLHPNALIFLVLPLYFAWQPPFMQFVAFVTGIGVVHTFISFIPTVLLGAPDPDTALSVLPGHKYLHHGRAFEAIQLTVYGGVLSAGFALVALPFLFLVFPLLYGMIVDWMHVVLIGLLSVMVWREPTRTRQWHVLVVVVLSGVLGMIALNSPAANTQYVLFPLFAGLFGVSTMLTSLQHKTTVPPQDSSFPVTFQDSISGGFYGFVAGILAGFLPGLGSSQSALLVREVRTINLRDFVITLGGITTADLFLSLLALYVIGNPRSGAAVAIQQVSTEVTFQTVLTVIGMAMVAVGTGALLTRTLGKHMIRHVHRVPYPALVKAVIVFIGIGSYVLTGLFGIVVLVTATMVGLTATRYSVRRGYCMAALIVPTILYYAGIPVQLF